MNQTELSDHALSILTFAAYHSLLSGETVKGVVLDDGKGHRADAKGVEEIEKAGFLTPEGERGAFTDAGLERLGKVIDAIRQAAS